MSNVAESKIYVVSVQSNSTVMLNIGLDDGVKIGDRYAIFELGEEIFDPKTGNSLGNIEIPKGRGEIVHVQQKMSMLKSIAKKLKTKKTAPAFGLYTALGAQGTTTEEVEDLPFDEPNISDFAIKIK